jgi:hypothetical protein
MPIDRPSPAALTSHPSKNPIDAPMKLTCYALKADPPAIRP